MRSVDCPGGFTLRTSLLTLARHGVAFTALALVLCGGASAQRTATSAARVLVFNIHAGKDASSRVNLEEIAALIRTADADVVLLQEVDRGTKRSGHVDQLRILGDLTGYSTAFGRSLDYDGGEYGIAALARQRISHSTTEPLPIQPPQARAGGSYEPRAALTIAPVYSPSVRVSTMTDSGRFIFARTSSTVASRSRRCLIL